MSKSLGSKSFKTLVAGAMLTLTLAMPLQAMAESKESTMAVPLRTISESIGAKVTWDAAKQQATVSRGGIEFTVTIGDKNATVNGKQITFNSAVAKVDNKIVLPLEVIEEALQVELDWNETSGLSIDSDDTAALGSYFMQLLISGKYSEARAMMNDNLQTVIPETLMPVIFNFAASPYGALTELAAVQHEKTKVHNNSHLTYMTSHSIPVQFSVRFDHQNKVDELFIAPAIPSTYQKPSYDNAELYTEEEVVVGEGATALPGTLTLPKGEGPFPSIVLVHGSGPNDRDESNRGYKTFRDLAVGLAGKGIAVLRYEKQTRENSTRISMNPKVTVKEEAIDDALKAVDLLKSDKRLDSERIFVIGHSQGGMLIPKIIEQDKNKSIAGTVVMAGPSKPLEDVISDQNKDAIDRLIKAGQPEEVIAIAKQQAAGWEQFVQILRDPQYSTTNMPQGIAVPSPYWWFDFRGYYAGELAKKQTGPLLILQGENDYQVTANHLDGWKKALSERKDVTYKLYPKLNHYFVPVDQPSTGAEYIIPGNVTETVINDIAEWLLKQK